MCAIKMRTEQKVPKLPVRQQYSKKFPGTVFPLTQNFFSFFIVRARFAVLFKS